MASGREHLTSGAGASAGPVRVSAVAPGVVVATETLPWAGAVALSASIAVGSVDEREDQAGAAHLVEHLFFRGSSLFAMGEVDRLFDEIGADLGASTDRCQTQLMTWVMAEHREAAVRAMSDVLWRPLIREEDVDQEREIVLEELAMVEDSPDELTFELAGDALFPRSALGRPVIGRRATIAALDAAALRGFHHRRYAQAPLVWVGVGAVDHDSLCEQVVAALPQWRSASAGPPSDALRAAPAGPPERLLAERQTEQTHVAVGVPLLGVDDRRRARLAVLDALVGGPPSSRLFQEVRERRGLAYSVGSFLDLQHGFGVFGAYAGTRPERAGQTFAVLAEQLRDLAAGNISEDELRWSRAHVSGRLGLSLETAGGRAGQLTARLTSGRDASDPAHAIAELQAVDLAALKTEAAEVFGDLEAAGVVCVSSDPARSAQALDAAGLGRA